MSAIFRITAFLVLLLTSSLVFAGEHYDLIIRGGTLYDGTGDLPYKADIAITEDKISAIGALDQDTADHLIDADGMVVAPGFINMLSWAPTSLLKDGRGLSDLLQGVTLEVFGEGMSMGPITDQMVAAFDEPERVKWRSLGEYMEHAAAKGISPNIASFVGATTLRINVIGYEDRAPTAEELKKMQALVRQAMQEGALGIGSSLIYAPAFFASTEELIALNTVAADYGGSYISHIRNEGNGIEKAVDELITIARKANIAAEIYHLKFAGKDNWHKFDSIIDKIEAARAEGLKITADMYTYTAGATGLNAAMPPWVLDGGYKALFKRLKDPVQRAKIKQAMLTPSDEWENFYLASGPDKIMVSGFKNPELRKYVGKTIAEVSALRGTDPATTIMDLVLEDQSRVDTVYFLMSEENIRRKIKLPWVSFGSDAEALAASGDDLKAQPHPRTYGNFARLLGKYVRDEKIIPLNEAIHRLTLMPATNLKIKLRGKLETGYFADIVLFDPEKISDKATFAKPHQLSTGMHHVFVNGIQVIQNGTHTGALPGRVVRGPGWKK